MCLTLFKDLCTNTLLCFTLLNVNHLCSLTEVPKTDKSFEERLIFKTFVLKFVNAFTPIIYIAFFRGRLVFVLTKI